MIDFIKKGMLASVGAAVVTKESAEKALNDLVEKGKISTADAREAADRIVEQGREEFEKTRADLDKLFEDMLHKAKFATQNDLAKLEARVTALEVVAAEQAADQ